MSWWEQEDAVRYLRFVKGMNVGLNDLPRMRDLGLIRMDLSGRVEAYSMSVISKMDVQDFEAKR